MAIEEQDTVDDNDMEAEDDMTTTLKALI